MSLSLEYEDDPKYAMIRATYKTISTLNKGLIDESKPITFDLIQKLSDNKKNNKYLLLEHIKNMNSLQRRLQQIETNNVCAKSQYELDVGS